MATSEPIQETKGCLRLISGAETLTLDPTDGTVFIGKSEDVFATWIAPSFEGFGCNVTGEPTGPMDVQVHEMVKDVDLRKIYDGLGDDLDALCLTQDQIVQFVTKYPQWLTNGYGTFFLFKVGDDFFVAHVDVLAGGLRAFVSHFPDALTWQAGHRRRFVLPQLRPCA